MPVSQINNGISKTEGEGGTSEQGTARSKGSERAPSACWNLIFDPPEFPFLIRAVSGLAFSISTEPGTGRYSISKYQTAGDPGGEDAEPGTCAG
jgi:hypothetical protein